MDTRERDAVDLVERAPLEEMKDLDTEVVYQHIDFLARTLPGPVDLYRRWERQQWSASAIDFSTDRAQWESLLPPVREQLQRSFGGFFYGEQAVTDTLAPLLMGAPSEEDRLFLASQVVDEARHAYFFARFFQEVDGIRGSLRETIEAAVQRRRGFGYSRIFDPRDGELVASTEAVRRDPADRSAWVQAIAVYHLMIEGLLALTGQRSILRALRTQDLLPGFRAGFTAVTRDESRHVSYGVWALREAVRNGHGADVAAAVDRTLEPCIRVYASPDVKLPDPRQLPPGSRVDPRETWRFAVDSVTRRLRTAELAPSYLHDVERRAWACVRDSVARYEELHGEEHPVRAWERGEVASAVS